MFFASLLLSAAGTLLPDDEVTADVAIEKPDQVAISYTVDEVPPATELRVLIGRREDGTNRYRTARKTAAVVEGASVAVPTRVTMVVEEPPAALQAAATAVAHYTPVRVAAVEEDFRDRDDLEADIRSLKVTKAGVSVLNPRERSAAEGGGLLFDVAVWYAVRADNGTGQPGYAAGAEGSYELWLLKDGKVTLLKDEVKLKPFLFL